VPIGRPFLELERAGPHHVADRLVATRVDQRPRVDRGHLVRVGQRREHHAGDLFGPELDGVLVLRGDRLDVGEERLAGGGEAAPALQRRHHVVGGHLLAVVEGHALAELDRVGEPIAADLVALGQHRNDREALVEREEPLDHVPRDVEHEGGAGLVNVDRGRLAGQRDAQRPALLGRLSVRLRRRDDRR
jgi:hypothetical protein